jgi:hypothetical protein
MLLCAYALSHVYACVRMHCHMHMLVCVCLSPCIAGSSCLLVQACCGWITMSCLVYPLVSPRFKQSHMHMLVLVCKVTCICLCAYALRKLMHVGTCMLWLDYNRMSCVCQCFASMCAQLKPIIDANSFRNLSRQLWNNTHMKCMDATTSTQRMCLCTCQHNSYVTYINIHTHAYTHTHITSAHLQQAQSNGLIQAESIDGAGTTPHLTARSGSSFGSILLDTVATPASTASYASRTAKPGPSLASMTRSTQAATPLSTDSIRTSVLPSAKEGSEEGTSSSGGAKLSSFRT